MESVILKKDMEGQYPRISGPPDSNEYAPSNNHECQDDIANEVVEKREW